MNQDALTVRLDVRDRATKEDLETIVSSMEEFELVNSSSPSPCDILIRDIGDDVENEFHLVRGLAHDETVGEFFLTSSNTSQEVLLQVLRSGAKEFLPQPINAEEVRHCLLKALERSSKDKKGRKKLGHIIDVLGGKGGIGTTTTAVNLSFSLTQLKRSPSVALIDMNLLFGEVPLFLDLTPAFSWAEIVTNISRLDAAYLMGILIQHKSGVYVLPPPTKLDRAAVANPEVIETILCLMQEEFDYVVIDSGQSIDSLSLKILELSDLVLLLSILSLPCLINVKRLMETFTTLGYPEKEKIRIVMNRYSKNSVISTKDAEKGVQGKISWLIPNDFQATISAINQGKLISEVARRSEIAKSFEGLATSIDKDLSKSQKSRGLLRRR